MATQSLFKTPTLGGIFSAIGDIYSGMSAFTASKSSASDIRFEGQILYDEAMRTSAIIIAEGKKFAAGQSLQYLASGVQVAGSALVTIAQTKKYAATEARATRARGAAQKYLSERTAYRMEEEGRAALVSGIISGTSSLFL